MTITADLSQELAEFAANTRFADLPPAAVEAAKQSVLDTIGVMLAASGMEPAVRPIIELVQESGGKGEATILGYGNRVPAGAAAFANGALAHGLDFDSQTPWGAHADSSIVPTVLALAELREGVTGEELITAVAVGQEIFIRLRCNVGWHMDWNLSTVVGCFSATAAGGSIFKLDATQLANALGIASLQSSGTMEQIFGLGSDLRGMYAGFSSQASVNAVRLAARGMTGIRNLFEGEAGVFKVYFKGEYDREKMVANLGKEFLSGGMTYKYWPAVGNAHTYIHAAIELMKENDVDLAQISEVKVYVGDFQQRMCSPLVERQVPNTLVHAKFSLPFLVALALAKGRMEVGDFTSDALKDETVLALARKVVPVPDSSYNWTAKLPDGKIDVVLGDGTRLSRLGSKVPGSVELPMTWEELFQKFGSCARAAAVPVSPERIEELCHSLQSLESVRDVRDVVSAVVSNDGIARRKSA